uniref:Receptor ligand binding region domain-containing protein n=1 Tax=Kalanchoe fedtschenkoi TaxID=63787 RepID=A0A7N0VEX4_KALFE
MQFKKKKKMMMMAHMTSSPFMYCCCLLWVLVCSSGASPVNIGIIDDFDSRSGKEERIAMEIAVSDFYGASNLQPALYFNNSGTSPVQAYSLAKGLIEEKHVKALMGFQTWQAGSITVDLSNQSKTPMLSLAEEVPPWATREWPFLINAARSQHAQMKAVVAVVQSWLWWRVTIIYEDTGSTPDGIISHLINELQDADVFIEQIARLSPWLAFSDKHYIRRELESLKAKQSRVFIVHTSVNLASNIFIQAEKLGLVDNDSVWITTSTITNQLDLLSATAISSMQGVLGVKSYLPSSGSQFERFRAEFRVRFKARYPDEPCTEPGLYALQAYDALWALALAINPISNSSTMSGESLVDNISKSDFKGLNGEFKLSRQGGVELEAQKVFGIVNVFGKSYREVGYWSDGLGFSANITEGSRKYDKRLSELGAVFWPGGASSVPRGYTIPTDANPLVIGVPLQQMQNSQSRSKKSESRVWTGAETDVGLGSHISLAEIRMKSQSY